MLPSSRLCLPRKAVAKSRRHDPSALDAGRFTFDEWALSDKLRGIFWVGGCGSVWLEGVTVRLGIGRIDWNSMMGIVISEVRMEGGIE